MRNKKVLAVLAVAAIVLAGKAVFAQQQQKKKGDDMTAEIMQYINEYRAQKGLGSLKFNQSIAEDAEVHSRNMACKRVPFGHTGFNDRASDLSKKVQPFYGCAENVAYGPVTAKEVVQMWLHSPGHRKNIEGDYNMSGIGVARGNDGALYFTQIFVNKKS
jgi:uncharacterized protein YkwD